VTLHVLAAPAPTAAARRRRATPHRACHAASALLHGARYRMAGLPRVLRDIAPDVFHAHFLVEHGFYGALAGFHPYVVTAWGSDVLVEPRRDPVSKQIARWTMRRADLLTSNNEYMAGRMAALGAPRSKIEVITLGADRYFLDLRPSVNAPADPGAPPCSARAHTRANIGEIVDAYGRWRRGQVRNSSSRTPARRAELQPLPRRRPSSSSASSAPPATR
jgi:hypothetical protein